MWAPQYGAQNVPYFQYGRGKRAIDPPTQEEMKQFAGHIAEFKGQLKIFNDFYLVHLILTTNPNPKFLQQIFVYLLCS